VVLDGVFNHTGRRHFAFEDVIRHGSASQYADWYFIEEGTSGYGDNFKYRAWEGHEGLPCLNHSNPAVRQHLMDVATFWLGEVGAQRQARGFQDTALKLLACEHVSDFTTAIWFTCSPFFGVPSFHE
jgi:glycosidase